jgi:hypothetical protein
MTRYDDYERAMAEEFMLNEPELEEEPRWLVVASGLMKLAALRMGVGLALITLFFCVVSLAFIGFVMWVVLTS